jgi:hypothetical protein
MRGPLGSAQGTFSIFGQQGVVIKKMPAMDIAGLCLPLKPQKERS